MKTTYRKLIAAQGALKSFYSQEQPYELRMLLVSQVDVIWGAIKGYDDFRKALFEANAQKVDLGEGKSKMQIPTVEKGAAFNAAMDAFADRELDLPIVPISQEALKAIRLSPLDHIALRDAMLLLGIEI